MHFKFRQTKWTRYITKYEYKIPTQNVKRSIVKIIISEPATNVVLAAGSI